MTKNCCLAALKIALHTLSVLQSIIIVAQLGDGTTERWGLIVQGKLSEIKICGMIKVGSSNESSRHFKERLTLNVKLSQIKERQFAIGAGRN